jgi:hypothetical protein
MTLRIEKCGSVVIQQYSKPVGLPGNKSTHMRHNQSILLSDY